MFTRLLTRAVLLALAVSTFNAAVVAQQPTPAPSHLAAARELLVLMQTDRTMQASAETMIDLQIAQVPELAEVREVMVEWATKYLSLEYAGDRMAAIYAEEFTEKEIRDLMTFYRTPLGAKVALVTPALAEKSAAVGAEIAQQHIGELERMLKEHMEWQDATSPPQP